jgi:carbonic anhydrase/acetyltransferase-like protein (isoleucine patch superfamily)
MLKRVLFYKLENLFTGKLGPWLRSVGQSINNTGINLQGDLAHKDTLQPSLRAVPISKTIYPKMLDADWVAPNATVIGDVNIGEGSSLWHGTIVRGDLASINIGKNTIIQDRVQITSNNKDHNKIEIGDSVYIGPNSKILDAHIESFSFIGSGAIVNEKAVVEGYGMVAAGAEIPAGTVVPSG